MQKSGGAHPITQPDRPQPALPSVGIQSAAALRIRTTLLSASRVNSVLEVFMDATLVSRDPEIMSGALCFTGTRVPVKNLFDYLEGSSSLEEFLEDFPSISRERAVAVLEAARQRLVADAPAA